MMVPSSFTILVLISSLLVLELDRVNGALKDAIKHDINWNPSIVEKLSEGQIYSRDVRINEYMDIFCPQFDMDTPEENMLQFVIYNVSEEAFIDCNFNDNFKKMLICNKPRRSKKLTIKFQKYSPNPLGFTYRPNKSYYFMAVPDDVDGSMTTCDDVMRMQINVHPKRHHSHSRSEQTAKVTTTTMRSGAAVTSSMTSKKTTAAPKTTTATTTTVATTRKTTTTSVLEALLTNAKKPISKNEFEVIPNGPPRTEMQSKKNNKDPGNSAPRVITMRYSAVVRLLLSFLLSLLFVK